MEMEKPYPGHAQVDETPDEIVITIPAKRKRYIILFMTAWLGAWLLGEVFVLGTVFGGYDGSGGEFVSLFMLVWLTIWTFAGLFVIRILIWMFVGKEVISISRKELRIHRKGQLLSKPKLYDTSQVKSLDVNSNGGIPVILREIYSNNLLNTGNSGALKFDYGLKTVHFADGIDEAEAKFLLKKIEAKNWLVN